MSTNERFFSICGISFCVECSFTLEHLRPFALSSSEAPNFSIINFADSSLPTLSVMAANGWQLYYHTTIRGVNYCYYGNSFCRYFFIKKSSDVSCIIWYMLEHRFVSYSNEEHGFMYLLWTAFVWESSFGGILPLHASTIVNKGLAIMFLGASGAGKSTQSHLWLDNILGTTFLNDDSPFIFLRKGMVADVASLEQTEVWVAGSAWSGKSNVYVNERYMVGVMVSVCKSGCNRVRLLSAKDRVEVIVRAVPPFLIRDRLFYGRLLTLVSAVAQCVKVVELQCLPNAQAARLLYDYFTL